MFYSFCFLGGPPPSSQINHIRRLILSCECLALAWLVSNKAFLPLYCPTTFCLWAFIFFYFGIPFFPPYSMTDWVVWWRAPGVFLSLFSCSSFSSFLLLSILSAWQPRLSLLLPRYWQFISFLGPSGVLDRNSNTASQS